MSAEEFDMWDALGVSCGGYSAKIDWAVIEIMKLCQYDNHHFMTDIAKKLELPEIFVELVQYIICSRDDLFSYGTSPRGCFPEDDEKVQDFIKKCEAAYIERWNKPEDVLGGGE